MYYCRKVRIPYGLDTKLGVSSALASVHYAEMGRRDARTSRMCHSSIAFTLYERFSSPWVSVISVSTDNNHTPMWSRYANRWMDL